MFVESGAENELVPLTQLSNTESRVIFPNLERSVRIELRIEFPEIEEGNIGDM